MVVSICVCRYVCVFRSCVFVPFPVVESKEVGN